MDCERCGMHMRHNTHYPLGNDSPNTAAGGVLCASTANVTPLVGNSNNSKNGGGYFTAYQSITPL
jgi:hypothetical protein